MEKKTKLTRSEIQKRYREKLKLDEKRYAEYKQNARERSSKQSKRGEMSLRILKSVRAKALLRYYNKKAQMRKCENGCSASASNNSFYIENTSSENCSNSTKDVSFIDNVLYTSSVNSEEDIQFSKTLAKKIISKKDKMELKTENHKLREQVNKLNTQLEQSKRSNRKYQKRLQRSIAKANQDKLKNHINKNIRFGPEIKQNKCTKNSSFYSEVYSYSE